MVQDQSVYRDLCPNTGRAEGLAASLPMVMTELERWFWQKGLGEQNVARWSQKERKQTIVEESWKKRTTIYDPEQTLLRHRYW